jgi:hypothetical protein
LGERVAQRIEEYMDYLPSVLGEQRMLFAGVILGVPLHRVITVHGLRRLVPVESNQSWFINPISASSVLE